MLKDIRRAGLLLLLLTAGTVFCACSVFGASDINSAVPSESTADFGSQKTSESKTDENETVGPGDESGLNVPDEVKEASNQAGFQWGAGIGAHLYESGTYNYVSPAEGYTYRGGPLDALVDLASAGDEKREYMFLLLADGKPVSFEFDGNRLSSLDVFLNEEPVRIKITFDPSSWKEEAGRLDFLLYIKSVRSPDFYLASSEVWLNAEKTANDPGSADVIEVSQKRSGLKNTVSGYTFSAWLKASDAKPSDEDGNDLSPSIEVNEDGSFLYEAVCGEPGTYRVLMLLDGKPVPFTVGGKLMDSFIWENAEGTMIQDIIRIDPELLKEGTVFSSLLTPLDPGTEMYAVIGSRKMIMQ